MASPINTIDAAAGVVSDQGGLNLITAHAAAVTVSAGLGTDTVIAGSGNLLVDGTGNQNPIDVIAAGGALDFIPGTAANSVSGGSGTALVEAGDPIFGTLSFTGWSGASTVTGALEGTTITGGAGPIAFTQRGLATVTAGLGAITIATDGNGLTIERPDLAQSLDWTGDTGDVLVVSADRSGLTTIDDRTTGAITTLAPDGSGRSQTVSGGVVADSAGQNTFSFGTGAATIEAALGSDLINAGAGSLLVDATGNTRAMTVRAGAGVLQVAPGGTALDLIGNAGPILVQAGTAGGTLTYIGGSGNASITGAAGGSTVTGGSGLITLQQTGPMTINAGSGTIGINADGDPLRVTGADGTETLLWPAAARDALTITTDGSGATRITDATGPFSAVLENGVASIDGSAGQQIADLSLPSLISLGANAATVSAARSADTVQAGSAAAFITAAGNVNPVVVRGGTNTVTFTPGPAHETLTATTGEMVVLPGDPLASLAFQGGAGSASIVGAAAGTEIFGASGPISLTQAGATTVHAGTGTMSIRLDEAPLTIWGNGVAQQRSWSGMQGDVLTLALDADGWTEVHDVLSGATYTFTASGITVASGADQRSALTAGEGGNPFLATVQHALDGLVGQSGFFAYFAPGDPTPQAGTAALLVTAPQPYAIAVPSGVLAVRNKAAGATIYGNGLAGQFVTSTTGFTYYAQGGSGVILADDGQAGGPAQASHIVLPTGGNGSFTIATGAGDDTIEASSGTASVDAGTGRNLIFLAGGEVVSEGDDEIVIGAGATTVNAVGSSALVFGGAGNLTFVGGAGAATVIAGTGHPDLSAGSGPDVFWGSASGGTVMHAGSGAATLVGGGAGNTIYAAGSADKLLVAGVGGSTILGGPATGSNFYWGSGGSDFLAADEGNDTLIGGPGQDTIQGGGPGGNATIFGGQSGDLFIGRAGNTEIITGGGAPDTFTFVRGQAGGTMLVWGFRPGTDHVSLIGYGAGEAPGAVAGASPYGPGRELGLSDGTHIIFGDLSSVPAAVFA